MGKKLVPYYAVVRWDEVTELPKGMQLQNYEWVTDAAGAIIPGTGREGPPIGVAFGLQTGFPLRDIMTPLQISTQLALEAANSSLAVEKAAHAVTAASLSAAIAKLAAVGIAFP